MCIYSYTVIKIVRAPPISIHALSLSLSLVVFRIEKSDAAEQMTRRQKGTGRSGGWIRERMGKEKSWIWKIDILEILGAPVGDAKEMVFSGDSPERFRALFEERKTGGKIRKENEGWTREGVLLEVVDRKRERERNRARGG